MLTEDYLMRLLRLATAAIAEALGLKAARLYQDALYVLDQMLEQVLGMRSDLIHRLDDRSLLSALSVQGSLDTDRLQVVADLLKEQAVIFAEAKDEAQSFSRNIRALGFYIEVVLRDGAENLPAPDDKISEILIKLKGHPLPAETMFLLYYYGEQVGKLSLAETMLLNLEETLGPVDEIKKEKTAFYERQLLKPDHELLQGGLPRTEIENKLVDLKS